MKSITAWHRIISDQCRENHGDVGLLMPLAKEMQETLYDALQGYPQGQGTRFRLSLDIEITEGLAAASQPLTAGETAIQP